MSYLHKELNDRYFEFQKIIHDEVRFRQLIRSRTSFAGLSEYINLMFKAAMSGHTMHDFPDHIPDDELNFQGEDIALERVTKIYQSIKETTLKKQRLAQLIRGQLVFTNGNGDGICDGFYEHLWELVGDGGGR